MNDGDDNDTDDDDTDDDTDDDNDHKNDSYTAAGAAPGASVPCSLSWLPIPAKLEKFVYLKSGSALSSALNACGTTKKKQQTFFNFLAGVLEIKIQLGRSLTRRRELSRPSTIG